MTRTYTVQIQEVCEFTLQGKKYRISRSEAEEWHANLGLALSKDQDILKRIRRAVCAEWNITETALMSDRKFETLTIPRFCAQWLTRKLTELTLENIAAVFVKKNGRARHHTAIAYAIQQIENRRDTDLKFKQQTDRLERELRKVVK